MGRFIEGCGRQQKLLFPDCVDDYVAEDSLTGHTSGVEVARYTRDAEQERMADEAFRIINLANQESRIWLTIPRRLINNANLTNMVSPAGFEPATY